MQTVVCIGEPAAGGEWLTEAVRLVLSHSGLHPHVDGPMQGPPPTYATALIQPVSKVDSIETACLQHPALLVRRDPRLMAVDLLSRSEIASLDALTARIDNQIELIEHVRASHSIPEVDLSDADQRGAQTVQLIASALKAELDLALCDAIAAHAWSVSEPKGLRRNSTLAGALPIDLERYLERRYASWLANNGYPITQQTFATSQTGSERVSMTDAGRINRFVQSLFPLTRQPPEIARIHNYAFDGRDAWIAGIAAGIPTGKRVLDAGCGSAPHRRHFAHCDYLTNDIVSKGEAPVDVIGDMADLPLESASFDAVLCSQALEHVFDPLSALRGLARILRPGGILMLTSSMSSGLREEPAHYYAGLTPYWFREAARLVGLEVVEIVPNGGFFKHLAQECARVSWSLDKHRDAHGGLDGMVGMMFGELLPRYLWKIDNANLLPEYAVGFNALLRLPDTLMAEEPPVAQERSDGAARVGRKGTASGRG